MLLALVASAFLPGCRPSPLAAVSPPEAKPGPLKPAAYQPLPPVTNGESGIAFVERATVAGLNYRWALPAKRPITIRYSMGNGCAFLDVNRDGDLDVLLVGDKIALYRGDGRGGFRDVTQEAGLDTLRGRFLGCAVGDYDNDGFADIYLSGYLSAALLHTEGGGRFRDVTAAMGLRAQPWGISCAFVDLDGDGYLDLFVCNYVAFGPDSHPQLCAAGGAMTSCSPGHYPALHGIVYQNRGGRGFRDVTTAWNAHTSGADLGVACADFDGSGDVGIAVANDARAGDLFRSRIHSGSVRLENVNTSSGTAGDRFGHYHAGMGVDWGDYDNDGRPDLFVATFAHEDKCLYHNRGQGLFEEQSVETGVASALEPYVSFGCKFSDFDNDGWLDLMVASGHVQDNASAVSPKESFRQPLELLHNTGRPPVAFERVTRSAGLGKLPPIVGRGLAVGDYDNDGRVDVLVVDGDGGPLLLHNETPAAGHWIGFKLVGAGRSNRDAYGAVVTVEAGGRRLTRECRADGSYLSSSDSRVHFGLGKVDRVDRVTVRWPDGPVETRKGPPVDRYITWPEGQTE
jgi:hypothetical protein